MFQPCTQVVRDPETGGKRRHADYVQQNEGAVDTSGYDLQLDWETATSVPARMTLNFVGDEDGGAPRRVSNRNSEWREWKGTSGPTRICTSIDPYVYEYRTFTTLGYSTGDWTGSLRWRHLPSIKAEAHEATPVTQHTRADATTSSMSPGGTTSETTGRCVSASITCSIDEPETRRSTISSLNLTLDRVKRTRRFYDILGRRYYVGFNLRI